MKRYSISVGLSRMTALAYTSEFHLFFRFRNVGKVHLERPLLPFRASFFLIDRERPILSLARIINLGAAIRDLYDVWLVQAVIVV